MDNASDGRCEVTKYNEKKSIKRKLRVKTYNVCTLLRKNDGK
jgi:hypothetical protein